MCSRCCQRSVSECVADAVRVVLLSVADAECAADAVSVALLSVQLMLSA